MDSATQQFVTWSLQAILGLGVMLVVQSLRKLQESVQMLNERVATVLEKTSWHEKQLERHDQRLAHLETH